jgi:hypothetical protein
VQAAGETTIPTKRESEPPYPALLCVLAGVIVAFGSFLPWLKVTADLSRFGGGMYSQSMSGLDSHGFRTLIAGTALILVGTLLTTLSGRWRLELAAAALVAAGVAAGIAIHDIVTIKAQISARLAQARSTSSVPVDQARELIDRFIHFDISLQIGLILVSVGGLVGLAGGILVLARRPKAEAP